MANLYDYTYTRANTDVPHVVNHKANYALDQTDTCTIQMLTDDREFWRSALINQHFKVVRKSDSFVEFRGEVKETRFSNNDRYNLTLIVKDPTWRLGEIEATGTGLIREPRVITAVSTTVITDSANPTDDEPAGYSSADNAVMIVPGADGSFTNEQVEDSVTTLGSATGGFAQINDNSLDTWVKSQNGAATSEWIQFNGSSANAKATVTGVAYNVVCKTQLDDQTTSLKLQYRDDDGTTWIDLAEETFNGYTSATAWITSEHTFEGYLAVNTFIDASDDWFFRVLLTKGASTTCLIWVMSAVLDLYTDNVHTSDYFAITSWSASSDALTVAVDPDSSNNPVTAGVAIGDTYIIGKKNLDVLTAILAVLYLSDFPIGRSIDANFSGYTTKDFTGEMLIDVIDYFCEREIAHWYFNHNTNTLEIDKESTILQVAEHEIVEANIEGAGLQDKTDSFVKSVTVFGATYRRDPDQDEVQVQFTYPTESQNVTISEVAKHTLRRLKVDEPGIRSRSEAAKLAASIYARRNDVDPTVTVTTNTREDLWLGERVKITYDSIVYETTYPVSAITINHSVADNDITQTVTGGWQRTDLVTRKANITKAIAKNVRNLMKETRIVRAVSQIPAVKSGDVIVDDLVIKDGGGIIATNYTVTNAGTGVDATFSCNASTAIIDYDADLKPNATYQVSAETYIVENVGTGTDSTINSNDSTEKVAISNDIDVQTGHFVANSVIVGDQTISEDGYLLIADATTPGIRIKDTGDTIATGATGYLAFTDSSDAVISFLKADATGTLTIAHYEGAVHFIKGVEDDWLILDGDNAVVKPAADNTIDLGTSILEYKDLFIDGTAHIDTLDVDIDAGIVGKITTLGGFGAIDVNFANGTIYKIEADGDAVFKNITGTDITVTALKNTTGTIYADCQVLNVRDPDDSWVSLFSVNTSTRTVVVGQPADTTNIISYGYIDAKGGFKDNGAAGVDGTFVDANAKTVTVSGGIITNLDT